MSEQAQAQPRWNGYQVRINGKDVLVGDLTVDQLRDQLCDLLDHLEAVDTVVQRMRYQMDDFRNGLPAPQED